MMKPYLLRSLLISGIVLLALLIAGPIKAALILTVTSPVPALTADGKTVVPLMVDLRDGADTSKADGKYISAEVNAAGKDCVHVLLSPVPVTKGQATILLQAGEKAGQATLTISVGPLSAGDTTLPASKSVALNVTALPWQINLQQIFAALMSFLLTMLLLGIGADKLTDLFKTIWTLFRPHPQDVMSVAYGITYNSLINASDATIQRTWVLMDDKTVPVTDTDVNSLLQEIQKADRNREKAVARWAWIMRLISIVFGILLASCFHLNALQALAPLFEPSNLPACLTPEGAPTGYVLTGFGASAGASFWQDFLDKLTAWKKAASG